MYKEVILNKFPHNENSGLYKRPNLPAVKLGRILMSDTRISSPNDVLAMHLFSSYFSTYYVIFTGEKVIYKGGEFLLEDVKEAQTAGSNLTVYANEKASLIPHSFRVKSDQVAQTFKRFFSDIAYNDPTANKLVEQTYVNFDGAELNWLKLRDEVIRTIDLLYERFNDGKLSLMEYENKKQELLDRL